MPADPDLHDLADEDRALLDELRAFGLSLGAEAGGPIHPGSADGSWLRRPRRLGPRTLVLAAAAVVAVALGVSLVVQSDAGGRQSIGSADAPSPNPTTVVSTTSPEASPDRTATEPDTPAAEPQPSFILAADGSRLAVLAPDDPRPAIATGFETEVLTAAPYLELVKAELDRIRADELTRLPDDGELEIHTSFDPAAVAAARTAVTDRDNALVVTLDTATGAVLAVAQSGTLALDAASTADHQPGQAFVPLVVAQAYERGWRSQSRIDARTPCWFRLDDAAGGPSLYEVRGPGPPTAGYTELAEIATGGEPCGLVRLGQVLGTDEIAELATALGVTTMPADPGSVASLPLGSVAVSPLELAAAWAAIGAEGLFGRAVVIERILDRDGELLFERWPRGRRIVSVASSHRIAEVLAGLPTGETDQRTPLDGGHDVFAAHGAGADGSRWLVGTTPRVTTLVRLVDDGAPSTAETGMWRLAAASALGDEPATFGVPRPRTGRTLPRAATELQPCGDLPLFEVYLNVVDVDGDGIGDCLAP